MIIKKYFPKKLIQIFKNLKCSLASNAIEKKCLAISHIKLNHVCKVMIDKLLDLEKENAIDSTILDFNKLIIFDQFSFIGQKSGDEANFVYII